MDVKDTEFFKDKINWKFFNYLKYRLTKYEDMGCSVHLSVFTVDTRKGDIIGGIVREVCTYFNNNSNNIADSRSNSGEYFNNNWLWITIPNYEKHGLFYKVYIWKDRANKEALSISDNLKLTLKEEQMAMKLTREFFNSVKSRCVEMEHQSESKYAILFIENT